MEWQLVGRSSPPVSTLAEPWLHFLPYRPPETRRSVGLDLLWRRALVTYCLPRRQTPCRRADRSPAKFKMNRIQHFLSKPPSPLSLALLVLACSASATPSPRSRPGSHGVAAVGLEQPHRVSAEDVIQRRGVEASAQLETDRGAEPRVHPLANLSETELRARLKADPESLGSISIGLPNSGRLLNGVRLPEDPRWELVDASHAYGTRETIEFLKTAIARVHEEHPGAPRLHIGHISGPKGGRLHPHKSHQSGRDVDLGYYYESGEAWYLRGSKDNLDVARNWSLVRALVLETDVRFILIDASIQRHLREHALSVGEDPAWVKDLFNGTPGKRAPLIRHVAGHATHMHVRFYNPVAQETARRSYGSLVALGLVKPPTHYLQHKVKKGETLIHLAKRYGTTVKAIKRANGLRSNLIMARKSYKIPHSGPAAASGPVEVPPRRLPPEPDVAAGRPEQGT